MLASLRGWLSVLSIGKLFFGKLHRRATAICAHTLLMLASEAILSTKVGRFEGFWVNI